MRTTALGKVKYGLTEIMGNTKYQMTTTEAQAGSRALKKEYNEQCTQMTVVQNSTFRMVASDITHAV